MIKKCLAVFFLLCFGAAVYAEIAPAEVKTDFGGSFRLRQEYWENTTDLQTSATHADRDFFRLRTLLWGKADVNKDLGAYIRIGNEAKYYLGSYTPFPAPDMGKQFDEDELYVDNFYIDAKNVFGLPIDVRVGRQDFLGMYGEGFLILDGTPADGSRSFYFNAFKATLKINPKNSVDLLLISDPEKDTYLPSLYPRRPNAYGFNYVDNKRRLNASDETGVVLYGKSKINENVYLEPYYIYKTEDIVGANPALKLNTLGSRAVLTYGEWKVRAEYAHQFGKYDNDIDRRANGGYLFVGRKYEKVALKPEWELGYVYLSGNDRSTTKHEGWNPLFSRAPMWNELYIYTIISETAADGGALPGYWTNLHLYKAGLKLALASATSLAVSYQYLQADQNTAATSMLSGNSKERGQLGTLMLTHAFTKQITGFLQAEYFIPGKFYVDQAQNAAFLRWQLQYTF